jgi:hypothetical protein
MVDGRKDDCRAGNVSAFRNYLRNAFRWRRGRQQTGYDKMLLVESLWPIPFDAYILRYPEGSEVPPHTDPVSQGDHYRLNVVLRRAGEGGEFHCADPIYESPRIKYFRPDASQHSVSKVTRGNRYVLSVGWIRNRK